MCVNEVDSSIGCAGSPTMQRIYEIKLLMEYKVATNFAEEVAARIGVLEAHSAKPSSIGIRAICEVLEEWKERIEKYRDEFPALKQ